MQLSSLESDAECAPSIQRLNDTYDNEGTTHRSSTYELCQYFAFHPFSHTQASSISSIMLSKLSHALLYSTIWLLVAAFSPFPPESSHKCYFIDGSYDPVGGPCYGNVGASMCCYSGENCYPGSALCLTSPHGPVGPYDNGSSIWRRSCTDFTWQDGACLAIAYGKTPFC